MRDPELMLTLLRVMADDPGGRMDVGSPNSSSEYEQQIHHHVELLVDAGHAEWQSKDFISGQVRINNTGYDFLKAIEQRETFRTTFVELFNKGERFVDAASRIVDMAGRAASIGG